MTDSLDQRYLDFVAKTEHIFARYPQLEALRYTFFKDILVGQKALSAKGAIKHWLRPLLHRDRQTIEPLEEADVVIRVEGRRESSIEALHQLWAALEQHKLRIVVLSSPGTQDNLGVPSVALRYPARTVSPDWAKTAWAAFCDIYPDLDTPGLKRAFTYACAQNRGLFEELDRIVGEVKPNMVLLWSTQMPVGAALVVTARQHGIPSLLLQHGVLQPFYTPLVADQMITWGESSNDTLVELGVPKERLLALGSPRHDTMKPSHEPDVRQRFLESLSLPDKPTLVFFSNGNDLVRNGIAPQKCAEWLEAIAEHYVDQINVVVRLHPNEDGSLYTTCPHLTITKGVPDLATTLEGCDWVGSLCSTVLVEGLLYQKPIWQFYADDWPDLADNWKNGLARRIASADELSSMIGGMLRDGTDSFFNPDLVNRVFINHGCAAQTIADYIAKRLSMRRERHDSTVGESGETIAQGIKYRL